MIVIYDPMIYMIYDYVFCQGEHLVLLNDVFTKRPAWNMQQKSLTQGSSQPEVCCSAKVPPAANLSLQISWNLNSTF